MCRGGLEVRGWARRSEEEEGEVPEEPAAMWRELQAPYSAGFNSTSLCQSGGRKTSLYSDTQLGGQQGASCKNHSTRWSYINFLD